MIASEKRNIDDLIVETLAKQSYIEGPQLVQLVQQVRPSTKPAIYIALRSLLDNEIVSKIGTQYFLSRVWINKLNRMFQSQQHIKSDAIFSLREGQSISYTFPSLLTCDNYWAHVYALLIEWVRPECPIITWYPHQIFGVVRDDHESDLLKLVEKHNKLVLCAIGGTTPLDKTFKKTWEKNYLPIMIGSGANLGNHYFLNVFDDLIVEVFIDQVLSKKISHFYKTCDQATTEAKQEFEELIEKPYRVRMKITRNNKKSKILRTRVSKDFYIPNGFQI